MLHDSPPNPVPVSKMETPPRLRHLTLVPRSGLSNRLRAIAAARRLCRNLGAHCTVVWKWGEFEAFFNPLPDVEFIPATPPPFADKRIELKPLMHDPER